MPQTLNPKDRGRGPLTATEARELRSELEKDEQFVLANTGLSRVAVFRAAAEQSVNSPTRSVIRSTLSALRGSAALG
jgi:hypothetical protein